MNTEPKPKITKDTVPEDFTLLLALTDSLPVIFFGASMLLIGRRFSSLLFMAGALLCLIGGAGKVLWKIIVVLRKKNIWPLFIQMRILMPAGFLLMLASLFTNADKMSFPGICQAVASFPSVIFFTAGLLGLPVTTLPYMHEISWGGEEIPESGHPWTLSDWMITKENFDYSRDDWREHPWFRTNRALLYHNMISREIDTFLEKQGYRHDGRRFLCTESNDKSIAIFSHGGSGAFGDANVVL